MKKIKFFLTILILLVAPLTSRADRLAWDIPTSEKPAKYAVVQDGAETVIDYREEETEEGKLVIGPDLTDVEKANFQIYSINSQGRRSATSTPFTLQEAPAPPAGVTIIESQSK